MKCSLDISLVCFALITCSTESVIITNEVGVDINSKYLPGIGTSLHRLCYAINEKTSESLVWLENLNETLESKGNSK